MRTHERGATPESVAAKLRSADPAKIENLMSEHRVYARPADPTARRLEVHDITASMSETWRPGRTLGWLRPHRMRTFELRSPESAPDTALQPLASRATGRSVDATFVPMTPTREWSGSLQNVGTALANTETVRLRSGELGVTPEMTGCSLLRLQNGGIGHLQPPSVAKDDTSKPMIGERAEKKLRKDPSVASVFGPSEYGRTRATTHDRTNAVVIGGGASAPSRVIGQSLFFAGEWINRDTDENHQKRRITTTQSHL